jgi:hypothetical protein
MKNKLFNSFLSVGVLSASVSQAAVVLSQFDFDEGSLVVSNELTAGSTGNVFFDSDNLAIPETSSWSANETTGRLDQDSSIADTNINSDINKFSFIYTVTGLNEGETLDIEEISLSFTGTTNTVRFNYFVDGSTIGSNLNPAGSGTYVADISSIAGTVGLENDDTITFSFSSRDNGNASVSVDNLILSGTVVPEPGTYALIAGCFGLSFTMMRRRRS